MIDKKEIQRIIAIKHPNPISDVEMLYVIKQAILDIKGIDVGEIQRPKGEMCNSFLQKAVKSGIHPFLAMEMSSDFHVMDYMFGKSCYYFNEKFKEI